VTDCEKKILNAKKKVINANAAVTLLEQRPEKKFQALSGIRSHNLCDAGAVQVSVPVVLRPHLH